MYKIYNMLFYLVFFIENLSSVECEILLNWRELIIFMIWMAESLALVLWCCPVEGSLEKTPNNKIVIKSNIYFIYLWESFLNLYLHLASHVVYTTCLLSETKYFCKVRDSSYFFLIETGAVRGEGVLKFCTPPPFLKF